VRRLEEESVIRAWHVEIDRKSIGLGVTVFVAVKVSRHQDIESNEFVAATERWPEVLSCQLISGDIDFLLEVVVEDQDAYQHFLFEKLWAAAMSLVAPRCEGVIRLSTCGGDLGTRSASFQLRFVVWNRSVSVRAATRTGTPASMAALW
jgi:DNA-binding Lrp family transcriptional regulator